MLLGWISRAWQPCTFKELWASGSHLFRGSVKPCPGSLMVVV